MRQQLPTIIQGFRGRPFNRDLSEAPFCGIDTVILLAGHPKVTDLHQIILSNQAVSGCQVPLQKSDMIGTKMDEDVCSG